MKFSSNNEVSNEFLNKKIIVTGASSGIGLATALYFLNCGAKVILAGRDIKTMKKICEQYKFYNAIIMKLELKDDINIYDFKTSVVERFKTIDILINCAGVKMDGDLEKTYPQDLDYTLDVNLRSIFYLIYNLSSFMEKNSSIINMSCLYGTNPMAGMISHNISKAGLEALTRYAAAEFSAFGIRVNAITACPVDTNSMRLMQVDNAEIEKFNKNMEKNIPLGRIARPDDITKVIVFLASERSKNITGQIIRVDGGRGLTSSGYVHYKGMLKMNSRFEPDGEKRQINNLFGLGNLLNIKIEQKEDVPKDEKELKKFINNKIKESNFSTNLSDAFISNNPMYKIVDNNDQRLTDKFLKGKNPNPLYDLKKYKKQIYGKNTGFNSVNIIMNNDSMQSSNLFKPSKSVIGNNQINNKFNMNKSEGPKDNMQNKYN
jgi:3-oxoacyl-[acyl-carrier protein] reductase